MSSCALSSLVVSECRGTAEATVKQRPERPDLRNLPGPTSPWRSLEARGTRPNRDRPRVADDGGAGLVATAFASRVHLMFQSQGLLSAGNRQDDGRDPSARVSFLREPGDRGFRPSGGRVFRPTVVAQNGRHPFLGVERQPRGRVGTEEYQREGDLPDAV